MALIEAQNGPSGRGKTTTLNLIRYKRRTLLTASLSTIGVVFVLVFILITGSIKAMIIGQITDSGDLQIHHNGFLCFWPRG